MSQDFASILSQHADLDELYLFHQEALVALEFELAARLLQLHRKLLEAHMGYEDHVLLPLYATLGPAERAPVVLYTGQHRKLLILLEGAEALLQALIRSPEQPRRQVIRILDLETTIKHLSEHHHAAESQSLYPTVDQQVRSGDRDALIAEGWQVWNEKLSELASAIERARAEVASL